MTIYKQAPPEECQRMSDLAELTLMLRSISRTTPPRRRNQPLGEKVNWH